MSGSVKSCHSFGRGLAISMAGLLLGVVASPSALAAQTKTFVVSEFNTAMYSYDGDCPEGLNPEAEGFDVIILKELGMSPQEAQAFFDSDFRGGTYSTPKFIGMMIMRGRINGKPVNVYENPTSVPDSHPLHAVEGRYGFGFNLDGKGAASPHSFEDPETHELGVNNNLNRTIGCTVAQRATPPDRPSYQRYVWDNLRESMPAWLISIAGEDLSKDGDVTITFDRSLDHVMRDANGGVLSDMTLRVDPSSRSHSVFQGKLKDGVVTITEPGDFRMLGDIDLYTQFTLRQTHFRLKLNPDGTAKGVLGGYQPWQEFYWRFGVGGYATESAMAIDVPALYYALKRNADAYPDPATGQNMYISAAYSVDAIPAILVPGKNGPAKTADAAH